MIVLYQHSIYILATIKTKSNCRHRGGGLRILGQRSWYDDSPPHRTRQKDFSQPCLWRKCAMLSWNSWGIVTRSLLIGSLACLLLLGGCSGGGGGGSTPPSSKTSITSVTVTPSP